MSSVLKLGTRRSLLAWAQSSGVARQVERLNPGVKVELVGIETRGDKIQDRPLSSIEGKEFFVAELDEALRSGAVDFCVHSLKDLSLERPAEFTLGAVPARENSRDVVLFGPGVMEKLARGRTLTVGTSSPRRLENIPAFLERALPRVLGHRARVEFREIRGNVNTRLSRVHEPESGGKRLDAVVLAFAGLIRIGNDEKARAEIERLLQGVRWMVLPLRECPTAPGQGALAVECRTADARTRACLALLDDSATARAVASERAVLAEWGGGCHQRFGATCAGSARLPDLLWIRGRKPDGQFVEETRWTPPPRPPKSAGPVRPWNGSEWRAGSATESSIQVDEPDWSRSPVFVAHARALPENWSLSGARAWTSGVPSWFRLAERGVWIEGCAEGLGFEGLAPALRERVLGLAAHWTVLTHEGAAEGWDGANARDAATTRVVATYRIHEAKKGQAPAIAALARATHIFWTSGSQFDQFAPEVPRNSHQACGPGKTADHLKKHGIEPVIFPSVEEWKKWLTP